MGIVQKSGRNPDGARVANQSATYAQEKALARDWPRVKGLRDFIAKNPNKPASTIAADELRRLQWVEWSAGATSNRGPGQPADAPYHRFLNNGPFGPPASWTAQVAGALLCLFALGKQGSTLDGETHRAEVAWLDGGGDLNRRRK